jgi:hypothetical protein
MTKRKPEKTFEAWMLGQFGRRPSSKPEWDLDRACDDLRDSLDDAEHLLAKVQMWEARRTAALYVWQMRDRDKDEA